MYYRSRGQTGAPWSLLRAKLAETWHIPPWEVDESPMGEVERQIEIWAIEAQHGKQE